MNLRIIKRQKLLIAALLACLVVAPLVYAWWGDDEDDFTSEQKICGEVLKMLEAGYEDGYASKWYKTSLRVVPGNSYVIEGLNFFLVEAYDKEYAVGTYQKLIGAPKFTGQSKKLWLIDALPDECKRYKW